jgi:hypothetical protein
MYWWRAGRAFFGDLLLLGLEQGIGFIFIFLRLEKSYSQGNDYLIF